MYSIQGDRYCDGGKPMKAKSLNAAMKECKKNRSCRMFFASCGRMDRLSYCKGSSERVSRCGSVLYTKGNAKRIRNLEYSTRILMIL